VRTVGITEKTISGWHYFVLILLGVCIALPIISTNSLAADSGESAQIIIYIELPESASDRIQAELVSIRLTGRQTDCDLPISQASINTIRNTGNQMLVVDTPIPPGEYLSLDLVLNNIKASIDEELIALTDSPESVSVEINVSVPAETAEILFIQWLPEFTIDEDIIFNSLFRLVHKDIPPSGGLIFVTNEKSDNITVINRFSYQVVDVIKVGRAPRGMVFSRVAQQLYVANSEDNDVVVIDLNTRRKLRTIQLRFGDEPCRLALSADEQQLYILNRGSNTLSVYDTQFFQEIDQVTLGMTPTAIDIDRFSGYVYISNLYSENITVYQPIEQNAVAVISAGGTPTEILVDDREKILYLARERQRILSLIDLRTGNTTATLNLCSPAVGLAYHRGSRQLYAALGDCSEIAVLRPENELNLGRINLPGRPGLLTFDPESRYLMAVLPDTGELVIINAVSREIFTKIEVGGQPYMAIVPE